MNLPFQNKINLPQSLWLLVYSVLVLFSLDHIFFWDTVQLASKQAHFFYENGFRNLILPREIDSGHPPLFGWMLALSWICFGKSLAVSHLFMLPWVGCMVIFVHKVADDFLGKTWGMWGAGLILLDPTLMAQSSLVSPDVLVVAGFLIGLHGIMNEKKYAVLIGALLCALISSRGAMIVVALMVWQWFLLYRKNPGNSHFIKSTLPFLPALFIFGSFQLWHFWKTGWIGYHDQSPWAPSFDRVSPTIMLKNILLVAWRMADFGRCIVGLGIIIIALMKGISIIRSKESHHLLMLGMVLSMVLLPSMIIHAGLTGHRYLLPLIILMDLLVMKWISSYLTKKWAKIVTLVLAISLITGNLWIYPRGVAQGWDSSMAHWPYFQLHASMNRYLSIYGIKISDVGCSFPNTANQKYLDLSASIQKHADKDVNTNPYFLYSNIFNDITQQEYNMLGRNYRPVHRLNKGGIEMVLYQKK